MQEHPGTMYPESFSSRGGCICHFRGLGMRSLTGHLDTEVRNEHSHDIHRIALDRQPTYHPIDALASDASQPHREDDRAVILIEVGADLKLYLADACALVRRHAATVWAAELALDKVVVQDVGKDCLGIGVVHCGAHHGRTPGTDIGSTTRTIMPA